MTGHDTNDLSLIVDGTNLTHRSHWALARSGLSADGRPVWAVHGLVMTISSLLATTKASHLVVAFDRPGGAPARRAVAAHYKANRTTPEPEILWQLAQAEMLLAEAGLASVSVTGWEADDLLAAADAAASRAGRRSEIVTSDRDAYQLVNDRCQVRRPDGSIMGTAELITKFGIDGPGYAQAAAVRGEPTDNLPGVPGIGEKTALAIVAKFGTLEDALQSPEALIEVIGQRKANAFIEHAAVWRANLEVGKLNADINVASDGDLRDVDPVHAADIFARAGLPRAGATLADTLRRRQG